MKRQCLIPQHITFYRRHYEFSPHFCIAAYSDYNLTGTVKRSKIPEVCEVDDTHEPPANQMDRVKRIWYLSPMRAVSQEEPSDRKPDPWPL